MMEFAFLQAIMGAEIAIGTAVHTEASARGVSNKAYKNVKQDLTFSIQRNVMIPAVFPEQRTLREDVRNVLNLARTCRNEFVHEGTFSLDQNQIWEIICASKQAVDWSIGVRHAAAASKTGT